MTLAQFIAKRTGLGKRHAQKLLENGGILLNGRVALDGTRALGKFDHVTAAGEILQANVARYLLLHKPPGILSATKDTAHKTVIDLIDEPWASELHLAGRLDRATTGLVILTNDGEFSESLTRAEKKIPKTYLVETDLPIPPGALEKFRRGMFFDKEKIRTHPAIAVPISDTTCRLTIFEGKHHQIKRMFLRFGIRVANLHRESIGPYHLSPDLPPGSYQPFVPEFSEEGST
jgi:16S rRNA pseudouridine516 synthase